MTIQVDNALPPNVVEIGNEITQGVVDGLMSASPAPTSANPYATKLQLDGKLSLTGGTMTTNASVNFTSNVYPETPFLNFIVNDAVNTADFGGTIGGNGFNFYDNLGDERSIFGGYYEGFTHTQGDSGLFTNLSFDGIIFPDSTLQTTAATAPTFATTAQAQAGTSTTTVVSPATMLDAKYFQGGRNLSLVAWLASTSGTGASSATNQNRRDVTAPTTAIGVGVSYLFLSNATRGSSVTSSFNWSKRIQFGARLNRNVASPDANTAFRFSIGKSSQAGGDLAERGIMVKQTAGGALQLLAHNGTTLTTVTSSFTATNQQAYDLMVVSDGAGNATLFVNDVSVATTTGSPTSGGSINTHQINFTAENTAIISGSGMAYQVSDISFQQNL